MNELEADASDLGARVNDPEAGVNEFDVIVVGSGFGGAVATARLAQAGFKVCLLERGRRYERDDFPTYPLQARSEPETNDQGGYEPPRDLSRWLWSIDQGLWDARDLGGVTSIQAAGYGGGSLVYASVHLRPPKAAFEALDEEGNRLWPELYTKEALDPYYDLVAFTLDVQPFPYRQHPLAKTSRLREAAEEHDGKCNWFMPPLAVAFDGARSNRWGREQGKCDMRGYCCLGCGSRAKSTLDTNYLAIAENPRDAGEYDDATREKLRNARPATIRTLAEVKELRRRNDRPGFIVRYEDRLMAPSREVTSRFVFLCAGAVNTTALLFENRNELFPEGRPQLDEALGSRYHPNGDALAVVFDCERLQQVDEGPTITSSLLYEIPDEAADGEPSWFLVQDGGVPQELDLVLGIFRSPLWLRRNRYREANREGNGEARDEARDEARYAADGKAANGNAPAPAAHDPLPRRSGPIVQLGQYRQQRTTGGRELVTMLPPHTAAQLQGALPESSWSDYLPLWLTETAAQNREELLDMLGIASDPFVRKTLDYLALRLEDRFEDLVGDLAATVPQGRELIESAMDLGLSRGLLRLGAQLLWGSEPDAVRHALSILIQPPRNFDDVGRQVVSFLRWCADYRPGDGRSAVLLTMGRDPYPGKLTIDEDGRLRADLDEVAQTRLRSSQERVLRTIAMRWGGELRTDPMWTFARRRVTVHSQGGCPMGAANGRGVVDENGEVYGCPGLFVMDAAAFPASVGVNPAATIAAIAERNVERFIQRHEQGWSAPRHVEFDAWRERNASFLDPLANGGIEPGTQVTCGVVGIEFREAMLGHFARSRPAEGEPPLSAIVEGRKNDEPFDARTFKKVTERIQRIEREGIRAEPQEDQPPGEFPQRGEIELRLDCGIKDLTSFLEARTRIHLEGTMKVQWRAAGDGADALSRTEEARCAGDLELFRPAGARRMKAFAYALRFEFQGAPHVLRGYKFIRDDSKLDVWQDTATLYFGIFTGKAESELAKGDQELVAEGILRLPPVELMRQVQSFKVTGTADGDRQTWALTAFAAFFFGHLAQSYVPEVRAIPTILRNMLTRTHG